MDVWRMYSVLWRLLQHTNNRRIFETFSAVLSLVMGQGLFAECTDPRCKLCSLGYIQQCKTFVCSNGKTWEIRCHINCDSVNVIYYLVCNMCNVETYAGKTWQKTRGRLNDHISKCRTGHGTNKFDKHVHDCGTKNGNLKAPYFKVFAFMKLSSRWLLFQYENYFHRNGFDTLNCRH